MITNVVDFGDSIARDVMIPRADMTIASVDMAYDDLLKLYMEVPYTRIPVYEDSRDNVIGILHVKDLFFYKATHDINNFSVRNIMRKPLYVYEYQKTNDLLHSMKSDSNTMAIVLDEYGICIGLITIEDLIEEIIGDIKDEYDTEEHNNIIKVDDTHYNVDGSIKLDDLNDALNLKIESEDYDSLGGYITELLDHIPAKGESVTDISCIYKVLEMDKSESPECLSRWLRRSQATPTVSKPAPGGGVMRKQTFSLKKIQFCDISRRNLRKAHRLAKACVLFYFSAQKDTIVKLAAS